MNKPIRVVLVPDVPYWICGTIARAIAAHAPGIEATICSGRVLRSLPDRSALAGHFDVVHFLTPQDANKTIESFRGRVATVTTIHHVQDESSTRSVAASHAVMTASRQWHERLRALGVPDDKLSIVPYGIDTNIFGPASAEDKRAVRERIGLHAERFTIGFVGKRSSDAGGRKGTDTFVKGIQEMARAKQPIQVLVVGPGWELFSASLRASGVPCVWEPFVIGKKAFAALYHAMDVYGCTSTIEGGPVPVLEAMASGVCCLATAVGMVPELVRDGENGYVIPFDDPRAFAARVGSLLAEPERCAAADTIAGGYRWEQSAIHATALYELALRNFAARKDRVDAARPSKPWPAAWIAAEEQRLTDRFVRDAHNPPGIVGRTWRTLRNHRWVRNVAVWMRMR